MNLNLKDQVILDGYFSYLRVTDNVYRILADRKYCNSELIVGTDTAAVIDTGLGFGNIAAAVRQLTDKPILLFNTHSHFDHTGGNALFGVPAHMGSEDIPSAQAMVVAPFRKSMMEERIRNLGPDSVEGMDPEEFVRRGPGELVPCEEGESFDLGGYTLEVYSIPGHSRGGRAYLLKEAGIIYTGDAAFACTLCFGRGSASRREYIQGLKKLLKLPFTAALSGHYIEPFDHRFFGHAVYTAEHADFETGIPLANPIDPNARVCVAPDEWPSEEYLERIRQGDHGLDNKVWALVLSSPD